MWALGCILYELIVGRRAFNVENEATLRHRIINYQTPQIYDGQSKRFESLGVLRQIYQLCMQKNQEERPSVEEILNLSEVQEQAKRVGMPIRRPVGTEIRTLQELVESKQAHKVEIMPIR